MKRTILPGILCCAAGFLLRLINLIFATDETGLPVSHHITTMILILASALILALMLFLSFRISFTGSADALYSRSSAAARLAKAAGAVLLLVGGTAGYFSSEGTTGMLILFLAGIAASVCLILDCTAVLSQKTRTALSMLPVLYILFRLMYLFKTTWSIDPIILDYCFLLFALIFTLLGLYYRIGFSFQEGKPGISLFLNSAACYFSAVSIADGVYTRDFSCIAIYAGLLLIMVSQQLQAALSAD